MDSCLKASREIISRRNLLYMLGAGVAAATLPGCVGRPAPGLCSPIPGGRVIDVHCHFFNASDVPVSGFVRYVVMGEIREEVFPKVKGARARRLFNALIALLVEILSKQATSAASEAARIRARQPIETTTEIQQRKTDSLTDSLLEMDRRARGGDVRALAGEVFDEPPDYMALLDQLTNDAGLTNIVSRSQPLSRSKARELAVALQNRPSKTQRYIYFALLLLEDREAIAREYARVFAHSGCVSLVTPSFLDMQKWLGNQRPRSSIAEQIEVMDLLQIELGRSSAPLHMHSFVGFDPWHVAEDSRLFRRVKEAIMERGFVGVKLYPPMGFRASANDDKNLGFPNGAPSGVTIDRTLKELYRWCGENDVPIMAHAENSLGSNCGYGKRASPEWWGPVLKDHPKLRVSLAHFGSFDERWRRGQFPTPTPKCAADAYEGKAWETIIGEAKKNGRDNLFADVSYLSELTSPEYDENIKGLIHGYLGEFRKNYDRNARHLLYGTDWTMIAKEIDNNNYLSSMGRELSAAGFTQDQQQNIFWKNAARFLGLGKNQESRRRLENYCSNNRIDKSWISAFDPA